MQAADVPLIPGSAAALLRLPAHQGDELLRCRVELLRQGGHGCRQLLHAQLKQRDFVAEALQRECVMYQCVMLGVVEVGQCQLELAGIGYRQLDLSLGSCVM